MGGAPDQVRVAVAQILGGDQDQVERYAGINLPQIVKRAEHRRARHQFAKLKYIVIGKTDQLYLPVQPAFQFLACRGPIRPVHTIRIRFNGTSLGAHLPCAAADATSGLRPAG
jgi:hypothetical protein